VCQEIEQTLITIKTSSSVWGVVLLRQDAHLLQVFFKQVSPCSGKDRFEFLPAVKKKLFRRTDPDRCAAY
jgi:hypothetical protein